MRKFCLRLLFALVAFGVGCATEAGVVISEVMAKNDVTLKTESGYEEIDWIELHNDGAEDVDVAGWYLSDNPRKKYTKWKTIACEEPVIIPSGGYRIVWADKDHTDFATSEAHVAIGLSTDGENLLLAPPGTTNIDDAVTFSFGRQIKDISYGVDRHGNAGYFRVPTPGAANSDETYAPPTPAVTLSEPHGFKTAPFTLTMAASEPDVDIYFTTNGVEPSLTNAVRYTGPIVIDRTTLIRAAVPDENSVFQSTATATYLFVTDILEQGPNPGGDFPKTNKVNNQTLEFGLNAKILNEQRGPVALALTNSIPVYSIVGDVNDFFGAETGIYVNAVNKGGAWERKASVELFDPLSREEGFQIDCGVKMRGAASRDTSPKHSFRFVFRSAYGAGKLKYPLFGDEGAKSFDKIDLRADQNNSWALDKSWATTFVHDVFCRDVQRDQGQPYTRSRYCHVYLNGQYWGLYQTQERDDSSYATTYLGGKSADWDFVRATKLGGGFVTDAVDGNVEAFNSLIDLVNSGVDDAMYYRLMGRNPDGTVNPDYPVYLNDENLMDYVIGLHYEHDPDSPWSVWNGRVNNMHCLYNRNARDGFIWLRHDGEYSMGTHSGYKPAKASCVRWGDLGWYSQGSFTGAGLHARLADCSPQYRRKFAERVDAQLFQANGVLTKERNLQRFTSRMDEVRGAVWAEAARWGRGTFSEWAWNYGCNVCKSFINARTEQMKKHYINAGWYPVTLRPVIETPEDQRDMCGVPIAISAEAGKQLFWTDDGSDPADSPTAQTSGTSNDVYVVGTNSVVLTARAYDAEKDEWSLLTTNSVTVHELTMSDRQRMYLRIADINLGSDGPFVTITNFSTRLAMPLEGLALGSLLPAELSGECPAQGCVKLLLSGPFDLTHPVVASFNATDGGVIQSLRLDASWPGFGDTSVGTVYFVPRHFGAELLTADDWNPWLGFLRDEDVQEKVRNAKDPALATNIVTITDGVRLTNWASRNGMTFGEVLQHDCAYLSFAFDTTGLIDPGWLPGLESEDMEYSSLAVTTGDVFEFSVNLRDLSVGSNMVGDHVSRFFTFTGSLSLPDGFSADNVIQTAPPSADGLGGIQFHLKPVESFKGTKVFLIKTFFRPFP